MATVYLVSCAKVKMSVTAPAKDLYISPRFRYARAIAERNGDIWYILSALNHLVDPNQRLEPYELTLTTMNKKDRQAWAIKVLSQLEDKVQKGDKVVILAGQKYYELIKPELEKSAEVTVPMEGLGMGKQLKWLKEHAKE